MTELKFVNPHAYVYFTMADEQGKPVDGRCELGSRTALSRMGWTIHTIKPGEKVTIKGSPGRNEANVCIVNSFVRADGTEVGAHGRFCAAQQVALGGDTSASGHGRRRSNPV